MTKVTSLLTSKKASEILGVHDSTVKRWCNQGELSSQATKGGHRRISWDDLMNFAKQQKIAHPFNDFGAKSFEVYSAKEDYLKNSSCAPFVEIVLNWMRDGHLSIGGKMVKLMWQKSIE